MRPSTKFKNMTLLRLIKRLNRPNIRILWDFYLCHKTWFCSDSASFSWIQGSANHCWTVQAWVRTWIEKKNHKKRSPPNRKNSKPRLRPNENRAIQSWSILNGPFSAIENCCFHLFAWIENLGPCDMLIFMNKQMDD